MLRLILPILCPSWRFFSGVGPSPRVEYGFSPDREPPQHWLEFRPRPIRVGWRKRVGQLFYNARWNEYLYVISCAEHLLEEATPTRVDEIFLRLRRACTRGEILAPIDSHYISFRIQVVARQGAKITQTLAFIAGPQGCAPGAIGDLP